MIIATLAFAAVMYLLCLWRFYDIVGHDFINSVVYLNDNTADGSGLPVDPVLNLFTGIMTGSHDPQRADGAVASSSGTSCCCS